MTMIQMSSREEWGIEAIRNEGSGVVRFKIDYGMMEYSIQLRREEHFGVTTDEA